MILLTEEAQVRKNAITNMERGRDNYIAGCQHEVKDAPHVERMSNIPARIGTPLFPAELEKRLLKVNPHLGFEIIENNPTHKRIFITDQRGKVPICVYENSLMPERSVAKVKVLEVPDPSFSMIDRKDMPDLVKNPNALRPGWRRVAVPWGEQTRGWRTVLVRLIQIGLISTESAEKEFGSDETPEWRQGTGKGDYTTPF
tara:strand:+ start:573 stop:1172 length:600 start_codon:yes stop_codon:yes gene_type:complete